MRKAMFFTVCNSFEDNFYQLSRCDKWQCFHYAFSETDWELISEAQQMCLWLACVDFILLCVKNKTSSCYKTEKGESYSWKGWRGFLFHNDVTD